MTHNYKPFMVSDVKHNRNHHLKNRTYSIMFTTV